MLPDSSKLVSDKIRTVHIVLLIYIQICILEKDRKIANKHLQQ